MNTPAVAITVAGAAALTAAAPLVLIAALATASPHAPDHPPTSTGCVAAGLPPVGEPRRYSTHQDPLSIPPTFLTLYRQAAARYRVPWPLLAGVGMEETGHGRNKNTSSAGARGPMQFMPATWASYGVDGDHDGRADILNPADSIHAAAHYLAASGATRTDGVRTALYTYNHATWYINDVLHYAHHYAVTTPGADPTNPDCATADPGTSPDPDTPVVTPKAPDPACPPSGSPAERGLQPLALHGLRCTKQAFRWLTSIGGVGARPNKSDHPAGRAVDYMIPGWNTAAGNQRGWQLARWTQANAARLRVKYVIFDDRIWRASKASRGWTPYTHPNGPTRNPTLRHLDHVHVSHH